MDANEKETFDGGSWPLPYFLNLDWSETTGLASDHKLSEGEWEAVKEEQ